MTDEEIDDFAYWLDNATTGSDRDALDRLSRLALAELRRLRAVPADEKPEGTR